MDQRDFPEGFPLTRDAIERTERIPPPMDIEDPPQLGSLLDRPDVWDAYDRRDQDLRRARWVAITAGWMMHHDELVPKLLAPMDLAELIDLDCTLTDLRREVRRAISRQDTPAPAKPPA